MKQVKKRGSRLKISLVLALSLSTILVAATIEVSINSASYRAYAAPMTDTPTPGATATNTVTIDNVSLSVVGTAVATGVTLDGTDQNTTYTIDSITVDNSAGYTDGWHLTIESSRFKKSDLTPLPSSSTSTIISAPMECTSGPCTLPVAFGSTVIIPSDGSPTEFLKADLTHAGTGIFKIVPEIQVLVPANSYHGTYTSNVTIKLVSGP